MSASSLFLTPSFPLQLADDAGEAAPPHSSRRQPTIGPSGNWGVNPFHPTGEHRGRVAEDVFAAADPERCPRRAGDGQPGREHRGGQQDPQRRNGDGNDDRARDDGSNGWRSVEEAGRPLSRRVQWAGDKPLEGYQFVIDNLTETLTFFVPKICGNISLMSREPSREAARRAEEARKAEAAKAAAAAAAADAARKAEEARKAQKRRKRQRHARPPKPRQADEKRKADEERAAAEARRAEEARKKAEQDRLAAEDAALTFRPFFAGYFGKQQRQYDEDDPAGIGFTRPDNTVTAFGDKLFGVKGGVQINVAGYLETGFMFTPAIGVAINLEEADRTSLFGDLEVGYTFASGVSLGTGLTLWDFTHGEQFTFGWLGTAAFPVWKNETKRHKLDVSVEWRQFFDRMSDPDVNYQFWGGLRYMFK